MTQTIPFNLTVHGGWGNWSSLSECSQSCGGGIQTRQRECDSPSPEYGGDPCSGNENETQRCNTDVCPGKLYMHNFNSNQSASKYYILTKIPLSEFFVQKRVTMNLNILNCIQFRYTQLSLPKHIAGFATIPVLTTILYSCRSCRNNNILLFPPTVHGAWGKWTDVSGCTHSCGGGTQYRIRMCSNPSPGFGGDWCVGNATEFKTCNAHACPGTCYKVSFGYE